MSDNPLLEPWQAPHGLPPFERLRAGHFEPALREGMRRHREELAAIAGQAAAPDFANTVAAFDRAGKLLSRVAAVFYNLTSSATSPELQAVQRAMAGPMARCFRASTRCTSAAARWASRPSSSACWSACTWTSCAPAHAWHPRHKRVMRR